MTPADRLLAILECATRSDPGVQSSGHERADVRAVVSELAVGCGIADPDGFARQWDTLVKGSIVAAAEGDPDAAHRAQELGKLLLAHHGVAYGPA